MNAVFLWCGIFERKGEKNFKWTQARIILRILKEPNYQHLVRSVFILCNAKGEEGSKFCYPLTFHFLTQ